MQSHMFIFYIKKHNSLIFSHLPLIHRMKKFLCTSLEEEKSVVPNLIKFLAPKKPSETPEQNFGYLQQLYNPACARPCKPLTIRA